MHSSELGRKMDVLRKNNHVCVAVDTGHQLVQGTLDTSCKSTVRFKSVIATVKDKLVEDDAVKRRAMDVIMAQAFGDQAFQHSP